MELSFKYSFKVSLFVFFVHLTILAQEQKEADSLVKIYQRGNIENAEKLELLRNLSFNEVNNLRLSLRYAEELI
ncbi:MAG: adenylate/guanylate cyclase domain-containing protein, partial [Flavobacterium sp.]